MRTRTPKTETSSSTSPSDSASFVSFMTLFGSTQQVLKNRMQAQAEQGLGPLHLRALCLCLPDGTSQQQLVQAMGRDKGQIARLVRELEERQLLVRSADEQDRRIWRLTLTAEGKKKCQWFSAIEAQLATDMLSGLAPAQRAAFDAALAVLRERIQQLSAS
jgi:DNA-binding MarR family transcriptional regulator